MVGGGGSHPARGTGTETGCWVADGVWGADATSPSLTFLQHLPSVVEKAYSSTSLHSAAYRAHLGTGHPWDTVEASHRRLLPSAIGLHLWLQLLAQHDFPSVPPMA